LRAAWLALTGVAAGLVIALGLGRLVKSLPYGLEPADSISLAAAALLLLAVARIAGWGPAARASGVRADGGLAPRGIAPGEKRQG